MPSPSLALLPLRRSGAASQLFVSLDVRAGVVRLAGRLDRWTAHVVHDAVTTMLISDRGSWTIDVEELVVGDNAGLRALGSAYRRLVRHGCGMTLTAPSPDLVAALTRLRLSNHVLAAPEPVCESVPC